MQDLVANTALPELSEKQSEMKMNSSEGDEYENQALLEAQPVLLQRSSAPPEYSEPYAKKLAFLALYFSLNLGLTLSNKALLQRVRTPWLLTVMHATATAIGCTILVLTGHFKTSKLGYRENLILLAFSSLFTLNIAVSNVSLAQVSVPFHQVARSTCPVVTVLIYRSCFHRSYSHQTYITMIPLILGVGLATLGDYYVTTIGIVLTALGVLLAAVKTVATNRLMTGPLALSPLEILFRMSPLAAVQCLFYAAASGELGSLEPAYESGDLGAAFMFGLFGNAAMAFLLNVVSFQTNKVAGALTMSVCGNLKQCLTILLGIVLFNVEVTMLNGVGMGVALAGAAWYSRVELKTREARKG